MTAFKSILVAAAATVAFAGAAYAQNPTFTAKLAAPAAESRVIAINAIWNCSGDTCTARPDHSVSVRACRQFVHQSGAHVTAYGTEERQLSADELARCNGEQNTLQAHNQ